MRKKIFTAISIFVLPIFIMFLSGCNNNEPKQNTDDVYLNLIREWDSKRAENLKSKTGWLNLAGLFWLKKGENKFGSSKENDIVFPAGKADEFIGSFYLNKGEVTLKVNENVQVLVNEEPVKEIVAHPDIEENTTIMNHKNLSWFVIVREDDPGKESKVGIRLRDFDSELVKTFGGIERFPVDTSWIITAKYSAFDSPKKIIVPNIIGTFSEVEAEGEIVFSRGGKEYSLIPTSSGNRYFIIFADETSGSETYGAGRFLYADIEDENGNVILDFNKAYNPPCAFTKYATCPLPPKENHLKLAVTAGEKNWGNH